MKALKFSTIYFLIFTHLVNIARTDFIAELNPELTDTYRFISPPQVPLVLHSIPSVFLHGNHPLNPVGSQSVVSDKHFPNGNSESATQFSNTENNHNAIIIESSGHSGVSPTNDLPLIKSTSEDHPKMSEEMRTYQSQAVKELNQVQCVDPEGNIGICQSHIKCASYYTQFLLTKNMKTAVCQMANGLNGICCQPVVDQQATATIMEPKKVDLYVNNNDFIGKMENLENVAAIVRDAVSESDEAERTLLRKSENIVEKGTAAYGHLQFFMTSEKALSLSKYGHGLITATSQIKETLDLDNEMAGNGLRQYSLLDYSTKRECKARAKCDPYYNYYRTIDGSCNNLNKSEMGMSHSPLYRVLPPVYSDGLWVPRKSVLGRNVELPNPRKLSTSIATDQNFPHPYNSLWVMQFGQFLDHDMSHVPIHRYQNFSGILCCKKDGRGPLPVKNRHRNCLPIDIPKDDPFYRAYRQRCMNFVRSMVTPRHDCSLGHADQLNQITSFLDSSNIYGSDSEGENELRVRKDGLLKSRQLFDYLDIKSQMLPIRERAGEDCTHPDNKTYCYDAGDSRVNEMGALAAIHVVWLREHNRVAAALKKLNPTWSDEILFLESRRIVNAEYQHITYNEWLPIIVGRKFMKTYGILSLSNGYAYDYDPRIDASVSNGFSTAAYRMGHSLIQGILYLQNNIGNMGPSEDEEEIYLIHEHFNNPFELENYGMLDRLLHGLGTNPIQNFDSYVSNEVTNRLFQPPSNHYGLDLISLNIQRGRDHGLPSYNDFRQVCQLGRAKTFDDLLHHIPAMKVNQLRREYRSVDDVDLFIGGICETPLLGALLGPTFNCLVGDQFARSKKADRFAYDIGKQEHSFTDAQLNEIRKVSWSRLLCDNGDRLKKIQPLAFYLPDDSYNPPVPCDSPMIEKMDLNYWKFS